jgi:hypothetical protein
VVLLFVTDGWNKKNSKREIPRRAQTIFDWFSPRFSPHILGHYLLLKNFCDPDLSRFPEKKRKNLLVKKLGRDDFNFFTEHLQEQPSSKYTELHRLLFLRCS